MRRSLVVLLAVLLLAGCARQAPTVTADPPTMPPTGPTEQAPTAPVVTDAAPPVPIKDVLPVPGALPEGLRRVELAAESPIAAAGVYFMDVPTGKLEAWLAPGEPTPGPSHVNLSASADGRWITATGGDSGYLIRRSDGAAFRYDSKRVNLEAGPGVLLAWEPGGFECAFLNEEMKLISTFTLGQRAGCGLQYGRLFSPDGKSLAVATPQGDSPAVLVNVATGAAKGLGEFVTRDGLSTSSVGIAAFPQLDQLVVELWLTEPKVTYPPKETQIRRYNWQGKLVADSRLPGYSPQLSPDGKLLAYSQSLGMLGSAVVVQELNGREPLFRLAGGLYPQWRADSKAILLESSQGYQLLTTDGTLSPAPPNPGNGRYNPFITFHPSPDDANLYILESAVIDQTGRTVHSMKTADQNLRIVQPRWGATAKVLSFIAMIPGGKGYEGDLWNWIMPRVQKAPFPAKQALQVADPAGECLNLRAEAGKSGKLIRCLPTGTRLELPEAKDYWSLWAWKEDGVWLQVKTEKGEQGWVSAGTHSITYSD